MFGLKQRVPLLADHYIARRTITGTDNATISKLLGMIGGAHDAEALTAARNVHQLVQDHGAS